MAEDTAASKRREERDGACGYFEIGGEDAAGNRKAV